MSDQIAFFDFDGTITRKDSLIALIRFYKGPFLFYKGMVLNSFFIVAFLFGFISNQRIKEIILAYFFRNEPLNQFKKKCDEFCEQIVPGIIRSRALSEIMELKGKGVEIVIVTASSGLWITNWSDQLGINVLGTELEVIDDNLTGKIVGRNCQGEEKVKRIREKYRLENYSQILAYGDSIHDKDMLMLGHVSFFKPFRQLGR